jgi:hypothetical protein
LEGLILSVRLFVYYNYEDDRSKNLARQYAITPEEYFQKMLQAGFGSLSAFGMSIAGISIGSALFVSSMSPTICSIFFGFLGYIAARWITGLLIIGLRKKLQAYVFHSHCSHDSMFDFYSRKKSVEQSIKFRNLSGDENDTATIS